MYAYFLYLLHVLQTTIRAYGSCVWKKTEVFIDLENSIRRMRVYVKNRNAGPKLHGCLWQKSGFPALAYKRYFLV